MGLKLLLGSDYHGNDRLIRQALAYLPQVDGYINCGDFCSKAGKPSRNATQGFHPAAPAEVGPAAVFPGGSGRARQALALFAWQP
jgi:predicted phosphodiesterase